MTTGAESSLRVLLTIDVHPERRRDFITLWSNHAEAIATLAGNHGQTLTHKRDEPNRFFVTSDWLDEPTFRAFEKCDLQQDYLKKLWPMRRGGGMTLLNIEINRYPAAVA